MSNFGDVEFIFENCEVMIIPGKYFVDFYLDDLHTYFKRATVKAVHKYEEVGKIVLSIHKDADDQNYWYQTFGLKNQKISKFDRIQTWNDITHMRFFIEGKEYKYAVKWGGNPYGDENPRQISTRSRFGHLYLVVSDDPIATMEECFPQEIINDEDCEFDQVDLWED
jgi:hypothetical protein